MVQSEYPKYTPLLAKILECVLQKTAYDDKIGHEKEVTIMFLFIYGSLHPFFFLSFYEHNCTRYPASFLFFSFF